MNLDKVHSIYFVGIGGIAMSAAAGLARDLQYVISGGKRHVISPFVKLQRYSNTFIRTISSADLTSIPEGTYAFPNDGKRRICGKNTCFPRR
jgi:UDP-N-acetylmuramate-alanine ligase